MILAYHSIHPHRKGPLSVTPDAFRWQMAFLRRAGYRVISLSDLLQTWVEYGRTPAKWVALTFDDGYQDNYHYAFPVLNQMGYPAAIFVVTSLVGSDSILEPELSIEVYGGEEADYRILKWDQVREMDQAGISFGSHSVTHRRMTSIPPDQVEWEITRSKAVLQELLGKPAEFFCYPGGQHDASVIDLVGRAGYSGAVVTPSGPGLTESKYTLKRIGIYGHDSERSFRLKLSRVFSWVRENPLLWPAIRTLSRSGSHITEPGGGY